VGQLAEKIMQLTGKQLEVKKDAQRLRPDKSEVMRLLSDNSRARHLLHWVPRISLDEGLSRVIDWVSSHLDMYRVGKYEF
jgi:dTDP-glucose 4,6-dehydratase